MVKDYRVIKKSPNKYCLEIIYRFGPEKKTDLVWLSDLDVDEIDQITELLDALDFTDVSED